MYKKTPTEAKLIMGDDSLPPAADSPPQVRILLIRSRTTVVHCTLVIDKFLQCVILCRVFRSVTASTVNFDHVRCSKAATLTLVFFLSCSVHTEVKPVVTVCFISAPS